MTADGQKERAKYDAAVEARRHEIDLFWRRSLFFWGFIAVAFAGYFAAHESNPNIAVLLACFGLVCSLAWSLANRGSKYWQENWEDKVEDAERAVTGRLYSVQEPPQRKGIWLTSRRYSVTKLTIALSDYVFLLWVAVAAYETSRSFGFRFTGMIERYGAEAFICFTLAYAVALLVRSRSTQRKSKLKEI